MTDDPLELSASDASRILRDPPPTGVFLLDCRTPEEHATARIAGAVLIPMQELPDRLAELEPHRSQAIIVHCHHGMRSLRVALFLQERGFGTVINLDGGVDAWAREVDPRFPTY